MPLFTNQRVKGHMDQDQLEVIRPLQEYEHASGSTGTSQAVQRTFLQLLILALGQQRALLNLQLSGLDSWCEYVTGGHVFVLYPMLTQRPTDIQFSRISFHFFTLECPSVFTLLTLKIEVRGRHSLEGLGSSI